jgi:hypothetical protein
VTHAGAQRYRVRTPQSIDRDESMCEALPHHQAGQRGPQAAKYAPVTTAKVHDSKIDL